MISGVEEQIERLSLDSNWPCKAELRKNVTKVESYKFPAVQNYITGKLLKVGVYIRFTSNVCLLLNELGLYGL